MWLDWLHFPCASQTSNGISWPRSLISQTGFSIDSIQKMIVGCWREGLSAVLFVLDGRYICG
ncbi:hypothetical protein BDW71DRAFT_171366 [Aspergillus fruticulosus]